MQTRNDNRNYNEQHFSLEKHPRIQPSTYRQKKALKRRKCYWIWEHKKYVVGFSIKSFIHFLMSARYYISIIYLSLLWQYEWRHKLLWILIYPKGIFCVKSSWNYFKKFLIYRNDNEGLVILSRAGFWKFLCFTYLNPLKYSSYELFKYKIIILRCTPHIS